MSYTIPFRLVLIIVSLSLVLSSCLSTGQKFYIPNKVNTPVLHQVGDGHVGVGLNALEDIAGANLQVAFRPHRNIVAHANFLASSGRQREPSDVIFFPGSTPSALYSAKGMMGEIAVGPHWQLKSNLAVSMPIGVGIGKSTHDFDLGRLVKLNTIRYYAQPTATMQVRQFTLGMGLRLTGLDYRAGTADATIDRENLNKILQLNAKELIFVPELGINIGHTLGRGWSVQYGFTNLIFPESDSYGFGNRIFTLDLIANPRLLFQKFK